jgi:hypothetical protein
MPIRRLITEAVKADHREKLARVLTADDVHKWLCEQDITVLRDTNRFVIQLLRQASREKVREFRLKDEVKFVARGRMIFGKVIKINVKTVAVLQHGTDTRWKVSGSILSLAE